MKSIWTTCLLIAALLSSGNAYAQAGKRGKAGASILFGEAFQPRNYRITLSNDIDFGLSAVPFSMLYVGARNWSGNTYVGYGVGALSSFGFYGSVGWEACFVACIGAELIGGGDFSGNSNAYATISLGIAN